MNCSTEFRYIISATGYKAIAVHSDLNYSEFKDYITSQCKKLHPEGNDIIWKYGATDFINPVVHTLNDFANFGPALIGIK